MLDYITQLFLAPFRGLWWLTKKLAIGIAVLGVVLWHLLKEVNWVRVGLVLYFIWTIVTLPVKVLFYAASSKN